MPLDANLFVFLQPTGMTRLSNDKRHYDTTLHYLTDINPQKVFCTQDDMMEVLKRDYKYSRETVEDLRLTLNLGSSPILDLEGATFFETEEALLLNSATIRGGKPEAKNAIERIQKSLERGEGLIKKNYFT